MAVIQRAWNRRAIRWPAAIGCALALGAYLTPGDLQLLDELESPSDTLYLVASAVGIALLIAVFGWHGVWLMIVATIGVTSPWSSSCHTRSSSPEQGPRSHAADCRPTARGSAGGYAWFPCRSCVIPSEYIAICWSGVCDRASG